MLTRRDRAAMVLALHTLRRADDHPHALFCDAVECARLGGEDGVTYAICDAADCAPPAHEAWEMSARLLRARLALYLRAVLRADRGDFGACPDDCWGCRWAYVSDDFEHAPPRRYIPLWEQAPATRAT